MANGVHSLQEWRAYIGSPAGDRALGYLYANDTAGQKRRYLAALAKFSETFGGERPVAIVSAPGRTELCGNHTDHQRGRVLAAAVTLDVLAVVAPNENGVIRVLSEGYGSVEIDSRDEDVHQEEKNTTAALLRGVAAALRERGYETGGFDAYVTSDVPLGSGLSSSAAFEVLLGVINNGLFNDGRVSDVEIAQIGQAAENRYFGKPCGLMDQMASSVGGVVSIDFHDAEKPVIERIACEFSKHGYDLCIVNAGGSHADLTSEYAAITEEMRSVAELFGCEVLGQVTPAEFYARLHALRGSVTDRAILRALHFFAENERVLRQAAALQKTDMELYRELMLESGQSSFALLQNIFPSGGEERSVALALALSQWKLKGRGAWRVHGGGFAGTMQALSPCDKTREYIDFMCLAFGQDHCFELAVRPVGGYALAVG